MKFKKAPGFVGKHLVLHVGMGDRTIRDTEILEGQEWAKFVPLGFLVPAGDVAAPAPAPAKVAPKPEPKAEAKPEPEPTQPETPKAQEEVMTRSGADKLAKAQEGEKASQEKAKSTRRRSSKRRSS